MFSSVVAILPHIQAGKLKVLAVSGTRRLSILPDVPTIAEAGVPGYQASSWYGILAPAGTPRDVVARLHAGIVKVLEQPDVKAALAREGADPVGNSPDEFAAHIRGELGRMRQLVKDVKLPMQ